MSAPVTSLPASVRWVLAYAITATSHCPETIARTAWPTCATTEAPPMFVESVTFGWMPSWSASVTDGIQ